MNIIIVASSPYHNFDRYQYQKEDILIGVEDGAYEIIKRGLPLELAIGDFDTTKHLEEIKKGAQEIIEFPKEKDQIDLELAINYAKKNYPNPIIHVYNAAYGRMDHELIAIKLLYKYDNVYLYSDNEVITMINKDYNINKGLRFSLIPLTKVELEITGAKYNLNKTTLDIDDSYTSSNYSLDNTLIKIYSGKVILVLEKK